MDELTDFLKKLRKVANHLSDEDHYRLHEAIEKVAKKTFGEVKDEEIEDWLDTERIHRTMKGKNRAEVDEYRCDTDKTMFDLLMYLGHTAKYEANLKTFKDEIEPVLDEFVLTPEFTIDTLSKMPWDAGHVLHVVLGRQLAALSFMYVDAKVFKRAELNEYIQAMQMMDSSYSSFGGKLVGDSLKECNELLQKLYHSLEEYLKRARNKSSERYEVSAMLHRDIPKLIASL